jgi:hypothetical protein
MRQILEKGNSLPIKKNESETTVSTVITLTLPGLEDGDIAPERATATLLIQRILEFC